MQIDGGVAPLTDFFNLFQHSEAIGQSLVKEAYRLAKLALLYWNF